MTLPPSASTPPPGAVSPASLDAARSTAARLGDRVRAAVKGRDDVIELVLIALFSDGHVLLEDYPGSGKTTLARALGEAIEGAHKDGIAAFRRIQFTPDLLPSDITGTNVFDVERNRFVFRRGPVFTHVLLADEINRTSPKVQAALLEAMAEKQVTVDNETNLLDDLFFVIATQNPLDLAGTYPLPTPQLDRFLFKLTMRHIAREAELAVLAQYPAPSLALARELQPIRHAEVIAARRAIRGGVAISQAIKDALVDLAQGLRKDPRVLQGASTRALVLMLPALQTRAVMHGRDYVSPEDLRALAPHVFGHRLEFAPGTDSRAQVIDAALTPVVEKLAAASVRGA